MTLTDNVHRIQQLACDVIYDVDNHRYEEAHCVIDDIITKCHALRRHIDHLQRVNDPSRKLVPSETEEPPA